EVAHIRRAEEIARTLERAGGAESDPWWEKVPDLDITSIAKLIAFTLQCMYHMRRWETVLRLARSFNDVTCSAFATSFLPITVGAQREAVAALVLAASLASARAAAEQVNPIGKVLELISDLQTKIIGEGETSQKVYESFSEWCEESNKNLAFEIKTSKSEIQDLKAIISEETAMVNSLTAKAEDLAQQIATDEADLKASSYIRGSESKAFEAERAELADIIDTLSRAIGILEKHASASLLQAKGATSLVEALHVMVQASGFSASDAQRLTALVQQSQDAEGDNEGAPSASVYEGHSGGIVDVLQDLLDKAQVSLKNAQNKETSNLFAFEKLKQSIEDEIAYGKKELAEAKAGIAAANEKKATATGDLEVTSKDLADDVKELGDLHENCMTTAQTFEAEVKSRAEELKALAEAKKVISENTGGAESLSYGLSQQAFLQLSSGTELAHFEAVRFVRDLGRRQNALALTQLANRMATAMRSGGASQIFAKVKGLIADMIDRLEKEADADAKHKAYCDKELAYADQKKADRVAEIEKLTVAIDGMSARSAQLKEEIATLEKELATIATEQATMDKIRAEENAAYVKNKADMEQGIKGIQMALKVLTEYYASDKEHSAAEGAGQGIIGLLEVIESDFQKGLSDMTGAEESAQAEYEQLTKDNEIATATKTQDAKYKTKESKDLDKATAEAESDRSGVQTELEAVEKYLAKLHEQCDETAPTYAELVSRRSAEIAGLRQALQILEGEAALVQQLSRHQTLRGVRRHLEGVYPSPFRLEAPTQQRSPTYRTLPGSRAMKAVAALVLAASLASARAAAEQVNPIGKVLELISDLQTKIIGEGETSQKVYESFSEWCEESNKNLAFEIKTSKSEIQDLKAIISEETAMVNSLTAKAEDLAQQIATDEADLKASSYIRGSESKAFEAERAELADIIDTLSRAIGILEKHASASLLQAKGATSLVEALHVMVQASGFSASDAQRLTALVQQSQDAEGDNEGAPSASVYEGHSGGIVDVLQDLLDKAQASLKNAQNKETSNLFAFEKLKQSIEDEIAYGKKELAEAKAGIAAANEKKATATGDLEVTSKDLADDVKELGDLHENCMTTAQTFEAEVKSRAEELKALAEAKKVISENTGGAESLSYGLSQQAFLQLSSGTELAHFEAVRFVRDLGRRQNAPALTQLANRMATAMRSGGASQDIRSSLKSRASSLT
ncbi:unnamed protein product, partial [Prorocentrum cordatum]